MPQSQQTNQERPQPETEQRSSDQRSSRRGFAGMDKEKRRQISSVGGRSVPDEKRSFSQDPRLAAEAGRKGALARNENRSAEKRRQAERAMMENERREKESQMQPGQHQGAAPAEQPESIQREPMAREPMAREPMPPEPREDREAGFPERDDYFDRDR